MLLPVVVCRLLVELTLLDCCLLEEVVWRLLPVAVVDWRLLPAEVVAWRLLLPVEVVVWRLLSEALLEEVVVERLGVCEPVE